MNIGKTGWVRVFQLAGNYRPEEEASELCSRHTKNQFGVVRLKHSHKKKTKVLVFVVHITKTWLKTV